MSKIINLRNNLVELDKIKAICLNSFTSVKPKGNFIKIEFKIRKEYIYNPNVESWELESFNDVLLIEYPDYDTAVVYLEEIMGEWQAIIEEEN